MSRSAQLLIVLWGIWSACITLIPRGGEMPTGLDAFQRTRPAPLPRRIIVRFSPKGGGAALVVWHMDRAQRMLLVATYQWSHPKIHAAFLRARARGIQVRIILDPAMERSKSSLLGDLLKAGLTDAEVRIDDHHQIFHHKVTMRDCPLDDRDQSQAAYENGSMNYSISGDEENAENAQVIEGEPSMARVYMTELEHHWAHARPARAR